MSDAVADRGPRGERIAKFLARAGVASRRDAEKLVAEGKVRVNNAAVTHPATFVAAGDLVTVSGAPVEAPQRTRLWRYHKPEGLVTTHRDPKGRPTVFAHLPQNLPRVVSVGRLDLNSEGLLLLTNDGALARQLELPSNGWLRRYRVRVFGSPTRRAARVAGARRDGRRACATARSMPRWMPEKATTPGYRSACARAAIARCAASWRISACRSAG